MVPKHRQRPFCTCLCRMATEVFVEGRCTLKSDVYSLGIVLWELATQVC